MNLDLNDDQIALREAIERLFAEASVCKDPSVARAEAWAALVDREWLALATPEARGGAGGSVLEIGILMRAAGRHALATPFFSSIALGARVLGLAPETSLSAEVLGKGLRGDIRLAFAHQEGNDFDPAAPTVSATRRAAGWELVGTKNFVTGGADAEQLVVSAAIREAARTTFGLFLVASDAEGVELTRRASLRGEDFADAALNTVVSSGSCIAQGEDARWLASRIVDEGTLALCWEAAGAIAAMLEQTAAYVQIRHQFGRPISAFQSVQDRLAEMVVQLEEAEAIVELASLCVGSEQRAMHVSAAKVKVGKAARYVAETAVQLHGGIGVTEELQVARFFRLLTAFQAMSGTCDQHSARYAAATLPSRAYARSAVLG